MIVWTLAASVFFLLLVSLLHEHLRALVGHFFDLIEAPFTMLSKGLGQIREFLRVQLRHTTRTVAGRTTSLIVKAVVAAAATAFVIVLAGVDIDITRQTAQALGFGILGTPIAIGLIVGILGLGLCLMETLDIHDFGLFAGASETARGLVHRTAKVFLALAVAAQVAMGTWRAQALSTGGGTNPRYLAELLVNVGLPLLLTGVALLLGWALPWLAILAALACLGLTVALLGAVHAVIAIVVTILEHLRRVILAVIDLIAYLGARIWPGSRQRSNAKPQPPRVIVSQESRPERRQLQDARDMATRD